MLRVLENADPSNLVVVTRLLTKMKTQQPTILRYFADLNSQPPDRC